MKVNFVTKCFVCFFEGGETQKKHTKLRYINNTHRKIGM